MSDTQKIFFNGRPILPIQLIETETLINASKGVSSFAEPQEVENPQFYAYLERIVNLLSNVKDQTRRFNHEFDLLDLESWDTLEIKTNTKGRIEGGKAAVFEDTRRKTEFRTSTTRLDASRAFNKKEGHYSFWDILDEDFPIKKLLSVAVWKDDGDKIPLLKEIQAVLIKDNRELTAKRIADKVSREYDKTAIDKLNDSRTRSIVINVDKLHYLNQVHSRVLKECFKNGVRTKDNSYLGLLTDVTLTKDGKVLILIDNKQYLIGQLNKERVESKVWIDTMSDVAVAEHLNRHPSIESFADTLNKKYERASQVSFAASKASFNPAIDRDAYTLSKYLDDIVTAKPDIFLPGVKYEFALHDDKMIMYQQNYPSRHWVLAELVSDGYTNHHRIDPLYGASEIPANELNRLLGAVNPIVQDLLPTYLDKRGNEKIVKEQIKAIKKALRYLIIESNVVSLTHDLHKHPLSNKVSSLGVDFTLTPNKLYTQLTQIPKKDLSSEEKQTLRVWINNLETILNSAKIKNYVESFFNALQKKHRSLAFIKTAVLKLKNDVKSKQLPSDVIIESLQHLT